MLLTVTFALCELPYCKLYVAADLLRKPHEFKFFGFLGSVAVG